MYKTIANDLLDFIKHSPTAFHTIHSIRMRLKKYGYEELCEGLDWNLEKGGRYYVTRNLSSIIAFELGDDLSEYTYNIVAAHSDSPTYKLKENYELKDDHYLRINTEGYGGMIDNTWFDRPLSIAGRVIVQNGDTLTSRLLTIDKDLMMIPNVAIHMNRDVNSGYNYNRQVDLIPLLGGKEAKSGELKQLIAEELRVDQEDIVGSDLFLYNRQAPSIWGLHEEFISSGHLDDLQCVYSALSALLKGGSKRSINVMAIFDNEEVGSLTKQGADSTFLEDTLRRINRSLGKSDDDFAKAVAGSFMVSADNAHAVHPNHPEHTDKTNCTYMNEGIVIKSHANQKYTSDGMSVAMFKQFAKMADAPLQYFANRSDKVGGSTLGNLSQAHLSLNTVDVGLPQLAMHSAYETAGIKDTYYMIETLKKLYTSHIRVIDNTHLNISKDEK